MYNIFDIADSFLSRENVMPHKKLQKLCYYAYAWNLSLHNKELFDGKFEAWVHGPVDPDLYDKYRKEYEVFFNSDNYSKLDKKTEKFIDCIYNRYGCLSALELEALSHFEDPWKIARGKIPSFKPSKNPIQMDHIKDFYKKTYGDITIENINFRHKLRKYWDEYN